MHRKLFIPGPVEVAPEILAAMATPVIGHRGAEFHALYRRLAEKTRAVLGTRHAVYFATASATGVWEVAIRGGIGKKALVLTNGAFSERWYQSCLDHGKPADALAIEWGKAHRPEAVAKALAGGAYDALFVVHSETSTGVLNPIADIARAAAAAGGVQVFVDAVSSWTTVPIDLDDWGIDYCVASVQKGFGLPPGFAVFTASPRFHERARTIRDRGHYFDLLSFEKSAAKDETPQTPSIPHMVALDVQADRMLREGMEARFARHRRMAEMCRSWARERGFRLFPEAGFEAVGLTCIENTRKVDLDALDRHLAAEGAEISNGYGKLKGKTFRIAHMGDIQPDDLAWLLGRIDGFLGR